jgi:polyferredoxin
MKSVFSSKIRPILFALPVAGFALWWYFRPFPWLGAAIAALTGGFTYFIVNAKRKVSFQRALFIILFVIFLCSILAIIFINNNVSAFMYWVTHHTVAYYRSGESLRSTVFPCTLTISQIFLGRAAFNAPTSSWMVTFPPSLNAFLLVLIPFAGTLLIFGRGICGWFCPFGGLPEAMVTGKKERWHLNFLHKKAAKDSKIQFAGLQDWVKDIKYGVLLASILLAVFLVFPVVCVLCPVLWLTSMPAFWSVVGLMAVFAIALPVMTKKRWWCQICPLGALFAMLDKISLFRVRVDMKKCDKCMDCVYECRMYALKPADLDKGGKPDEDCIRCGRCIEACPEKAVDMYFMGTSVKIHDAFISLSMMAILAWYVWFAMILFGKFVK